MSLFEARPADASADRTKKRDSASADLLDQAFAAGWISSLDRQFARRVAEIFDARSDSIEWAETEVPIRCKLSHGHAYTHVGVK